MVFLIQHLYPLNDGYVNVVFSVREPKEMEMNMIKSDKEKNVGK